MQPKTAGEKIQDRATTSAFSVRDFEWKVNHWKEEVGRLSMEQKLIQQAQLKKQVSRSARKPFLNSFCQLFIFSSPSCSCSQRDRNVKI
jgi:hypothetical protein